MSSPENSKSAAVGLVPLHTGRHLESSFIESLKKKYPKACNRSLTNLSVVGLADDAPDRENYDDKRPKAARRLSLKIMSNSRVPLSVKENDSLSNFCKGLSSSQPDLLQASDLKFTCQENAGVNIDVPQSPQTSNSLGGWNTSMSGLHLLKTDDQSPRLKSSLSTASIHQRLQESKQRMNQIATRISVISRSNNNLLDIDNNSATNPSQPRPLMPCKQSLTPKLSTTDIDIGDLPTVSAKLSDNQELSPALIIDTDSDEVDDSAPLPVSHAHKKGTASAKLRPSQRNSTSDMYSNHPRNKSASTASLSTLETKDRLEEMRARLAEKCENLQRRRMALLSKISVRSAGGNDKVKLPSSDALIVTKPREIIESLPTASLDGEQEIPVVEHRKPSVDIVYVTIPPRKSGTDSDGDSGIDLSLKRHKLGTKNSLAPKLRKFNGTSSLRLNKQSHELSFPMASSRATVEIARLTPPAEDAIDKSEDSVDTTSLSQPSISSLSSQSQLSVSKSECHSEPHEIHNNTPKEQLQHPLSTSSILKESKPDTPRRSDSAKSVRFTRCPAVIENTTPRLVELTQLAESSVFSSQDDTFLQDTALNGFDTDSSEYSSDDSNRSSPDLTGIDPRIAQLALGVRNYSKKSKEEPPRKQTADLPQGNTPDHAEKPGPPKQNKSENSTQLHSKSAPEYQLTKVDKKKAQTISGRESVGLWASNETLGASSRSNAAKSLHGKMNPSDSLQSPRTSQVGAKINTPPTNDANMDITTQNHTRQSPKTKSEPLQNSLSQLAGSNPSSVSNNKPIDSPDRQLCTKQKVSPPKPPRLSQSEENPSAPSENQAKYDSLKQEDQNVIYQTPAIIKPTESCSDEADDNVQPYAVVDTSAFQKLDQSANKNKKKKKKAKASAVAQEKKPPLPKSSPPKSSPSGSISSLNRLRTDSAASSHINSLGDSPRSDTRIQPQQKDRSESLPASSRRSRLDSADFHPPYSYSEKRPCAPQRNDCDWDSIMTEDDRASVSSKPSSVASSTNKSNDIITTPRKPDKRSTATANDRQSRPSSASSKRPVRPSSLPPPANRSVPSEFSKPPPAAAGTREDLWGSNASLHSGQSNLGSSSSLSGSRSSLFERVGSFKQAAKKKFKSLKRTLSLDRLNGDSRDSKNFADIPPPAPLSKTKKSPKSNKSPHDQPTPDNTGNVPAIKKSLSWKTLDKLKFSKKSAYSVNQSTGDVTPAQKSRKSPKKAMVSSPMSPSAASPVDNPNHFRAIGRMLEVCPDGCQMIQLNKPPHGPYGFYIGQSESRPGYFVTRLSDSYAEKLFCGLLCVGDEIREVNGILTSRLDLDDIYDLISKNDKLLLKVKSNRLATQDEWF